VIQDVDGARVERDLREGRSYEQVARSLIEDGFHPVKVVKALREAGVPLEDGKRIVDECLPEAQRRANERLRDAAVEVLLATPDVVVHEEGS
jgi:hypothetical protein